MTKAKRLILTNEWVEMKEMFETNTNGNDEYGKNFKIGGKLDILTRTFLDKLGDLTSLKGHYCIIDGVKMNLWKERLWSVIENAGLLAPIAWKTDLALEEEMAAKIKAQTDWDNDEFDDIEDYEPSDEEVRQCVGKGIPLPTELKLK